MIFVIHEDDGDDREEDREDCSDDFDLDGWISVIVSSVIQSRC
jgi:hypothetical protein